MHVLWNVDPVMVHLGPIELRWYGLLFAGGILAAYLVGVGSFEQAGGSREETNRLLGYVVIGTIVGARLGHCLLYEPGYYLRHPLEIVAVWRGGLASHGGVAGIVVAVWLFGRRTGRSALWLLDRVAVGAPLAAACIRVGNFFNSEIIGRRATSHGLWSSLGSICSRGIRRCSTRQRRIWSSSRRWSCSSGAPLCASDRAR